MRRIGFDCNMKNHRKQCKIAKCEHPAIYFGKVFGWCKKCRDVACKEDQLGRALKEDEI